MGCFGIVNAQKVQFQYDEAGNQRNRQYICINCQQIAAAKEPETTVLASEKRVEAVEIGEKSRLIKAWPNPVNEILNVSWQIREENIFIKTIEVYTMNGVKAFSKKVSPQEGGAQIAFENLAPGAYLLHIVYSDNKREVIKIVKI